MTILQAIILGLVQGLTEFIPVSSSGHLVMMHHLFGVEAQGLTFDVALHIGTLAALVIYFWNDIWKITKSLFVKSEETKLAYMLIIATLPAVVFGILLESRAESAFRSVRLVSVNLIVVAGIMLLAEWWYAKQKTRTTIGKIRPKQAITMGLAQAAAIVPGVSRSGSTIVAGLFSGLDRVAATRFSFLLGIPITAGAIAKVLTGDDAVKAISSETSIFAVGIISAFVSGICAIVFMLRYLSKHGLHIFAYYRIALGILVLVLVTLR